MSIKMLLREEIQRDKDYLDGLDIGSDEYKAVTDSLIKKADRLIELEKIDSEVEEKRESRFIETNLKTAQMKQDKKLAIAKIIVEVTIVGIQIGTYFRAMNKSLKFEETGTITTSFGKASISSLTRIFKR